MTKREMIFVGVGKKRPAVSKVFCLNPKYEIKDKYSFSIPIMPCFGMPRDPIRPKYAIGFCKDNGYFIVKDSFFGYRAVVEFSFGGAPIIVCYSNPKDSSLGNPEDAGFKKTQERLKFYLIYKYTE